MIWFFLAGFIAGVVGTVMFIMHWVRTHAVRVTPDQMIRDIEESKQKREEEKHD